MTRQYRVARRPPPGETPLQARLRIAAQGIPKSWAESDKERKQNPGQLQTRGLRNKGNYCYRNGLLQGLIHQPVFSRWARWHHNTTCTISNGQKCIACALHNLITQYWNSNSNTLAPFSNQLDRFHDNLNRAGWTRDSGQQDAHELYTRIYDSLFEQLPTDHDMLHGLFSVLIRISRRCLICENITFQTEPQQDLEVNLPRGEKNLTLVKLLKQTFGPEILAEVDCDQCHQRVLKESRRMIEAAPDALTVHLRRYVYDQKNTGRISKLNEAVMISPKLNLSQYYIHLPGTPKTPLHYELVGVEKHRGPYGSGHYVTDAKQPNKRWMHANDATVRPSTGHEATSHKTRDGTGGFVPYLLFYRRVLQYTERED
ncbi:hypothetical protein MMC30_006894 [Trapelia coarctata]|nr:hypothetical protein [Trapelia coarctata]